ncbi:MAG: glycine dehydrogenase (aminomethyl-transferring), partial [Elusimicrobia bacterium]|nr:glycine dehydrogenase (aminomethyl-transferring) [Elusimicrobiota bacterium]
MTLTEPAARPAAAPAASEQDGFSSRHIGPRETELKEMLRETGFASLDELCQAAVTPELRSKQPLDLPPALSEADAAKRLARLAGKNQVFRSFLGMGYAGCLPPAVIRRNVLENPGWYTQYTPYQPEISQGRLEALLNFQTMVIELTGLDVANASLLDEATAAAEAMALAKAAKGGPGRDVFLAAADLHPQTLALLMTRAEPLGVAVRVQDPASFDLSVAFGLLVQNPSTDGTLRDFSGLFAKARAAGVFSAAAVDPLSLMLVRSPGEMGADCALGSTQRFGVPMGYGGPHAAFMAVKDEFKRLLPGRLVGLSKDAHGRPALRLALQTREQHIRREKATSNICTAQVLLAVMASMYAVYHGPEGLTAIAARVRRLTLALRAALKAAGLAVADGPVFDALKVSVDAGRRGDVLARAAERRVNLRQYPDGALGVSLDETVPAADLADLAWVLTGRKAEPAGADEALPPALARASRPLSHPVFSRHHSEHAMLRYLKGLEAKDLSLTTSMIPLGSCTMKLNASSEMLPVTWPEFGRMHPFAPADQTQGYREMTAQLEAWLAEIT